jgi:hypothetical protein
MVLAAFGLRFPHPYHLFLYCAGLVCLVAMYPLHFHDFCVPTRDSINTSAVIVNRRIDREKFNGEYYGVVQLEYTLKPKCVRLCDMLVIGEQQSALNVTTFLHFYYRLHTTLKNVVCNRRGCQYQDLECTPVPLQYSNEF